MPEEVKAAEPAMVEMTKSTTRISVPPELVEMWKKDGWTVVEKK